MKAPADANNFMSRLWNAIGEFNPAGLSKRQWRVLGIVSTAGIFNDYDGELINLVLHLVQNSLNISACGLAPMVSLIKLGAVIAPFITAQADRFGRRRLLMLTIVGYTIFTGVTAVAWSGLTFAAFRVGATAFSSAEGSIALLSSAKHCDIPKPGTFTLARRKSSRTVTMICRTQ